MSQVIPPEPELVCRQCGRPEALAVGDEILCASCCHERGSCGAVREDEDGARPQTEARMLDQSRG